jgi:hypothetical protein
MSLRRAGSVFFPVRQQRLPIAEVDGIPSGLVALLRRRVPVVLIITLPMLRIDEIRSRIGGSCRRRCSGKWRI